MEKFRKYLKIATNKYLLVALGTIVWMLFFDRFDLPSRMKMRTKIRQMEADRDFYRTEIGRIAERKAVLFNDDGELERFARERYLMKKENEDLFIIVKED